MNGRVLLLLLVVPLAGCLTDGPSDPATDAFAVSADALEAGGAYLFHHDGGVLHMGISEGGEAVLALYDDGDIRLGTVELSDDTFRRDIDLDDRPAGDYVLVVSKLDGDLSVMSGDQEVDAFQGLGDHFERVVLAEEPLNQGPGLPQSGISLTPNPVDQDGNLTLLRTPLKVRILVAGEAQDFHLRLRGDAGVIMDHEISSYSTQDPLVGNAYMEDLGASFDAFNLRGPRIHFDLNAQDLHGVVILESWSFSRHLLPEQPAATESSDDPAFAYGAIPTRPVLFEVHPRAEALYLWSDPRGPGNPEDGVDLGSPPEDPSADESNVTPSLTLYGPDDERIGTYLVPSGVLLKIPVVEHGDHVAVSRDGEVYLGADRAPVDLQLHVLDTVSTQFPDGPAGATDDYEQRSGHFMPTGTPYRITATLASNDQGGQGFDDPLQEPLTTGCTDPGTVRVVEDGETVAFVRSDLSAYTVRLQDRIPSDGLEWIQDGMGGSCGYTAFSVMQYLR